MELGFIKDIINLEIKYSNNGISVPSAHIKRISNIIKQLNQEEKKSCAIYIEKFKKLNGVATEDEVEFAIDNLEKLCEFGENIASFMDYKQVINSFDDLAMKFKLLVSSSDKDYSLLKIRVDKLLTKSFRELLPIMLATQLTKKGVTND